MGATTYSTVGLAFSQDRDSCDTITRAAPQGDSNWERGFSDIPAAIANAVFHATGKRNRELPITPDKLL